MNVLYNTCIGDPFAYVARRLNDDYGYKPVYWIAYDSFSDGLADKENDLILRDFPNICFHTYRDAWHNIFPEAVESAAKERYLDVDMLKSIAQYELQALKMMDRMDSGYAFSYMERERHYLNLIKKWTACIELFHIDLVISAVNPHRVYDYVLYLVCRYRNIPYLTFQHTLCEDRTFCINNIYTIGDIFEESYNKHLQDTELTKDDLSEDILEQYKKVTKSYKEAAPPYMAKHNIDNKKATRISTMTKRFFKSYKNRIIGPESFLVKGVSAMKVRGKSLEDSYTSVFNQFRLSRKNTQYRNNLRKFYSSLTSVPDFSQKYIYLGLHYQPEETTSPSGDIFVNQLLCVETLLRNTPDDMFIYVKEHPQQFQHHMEGHKCRNKDYYKDLLSSPRVKLMPLEMDSFHLMQNATAVATVTGTVGWEALMHHIPVIIFGLIWYEKMPGVLRVTDSDSAAKINTFIKDYEFDEHKVLAYLKAYEDNSVYAYHYFGQKERTGISQEMTVDNIVKLIVGQLNK